MSTRASNSAASQPAAAVGRHGDRVVDREAPVPPREQHLEALERRAIHQALQRSGGNQRQAARALAIAESTLRGKIRKHELDIKALVSDLADRRQL
jgi:DNA-binding NtrC family response regulator